MYTTIPNRINNGFTYRIGFVVLMIVGVLHTTYAQRLDYERLRATGPVPAEYTEFFTTKYLEASQNVDSRANRKMRKRQDVFHKNNQYFLDEMMTSGKILYGDPVTNYLQEVMDYLLDVYGQTNKDVRVFTVRSPQFNAAATEDGILLVNLGLLAQVENEAQLAFILSHELIHTEENHVMDGFLEKMKIQKGEDAYRRQGSDDKLIAMSNYSKSHEFEADLEGYKRIFAKTNYDPEEALRVLDVMLYSYLPFDEVEMDKAFFNSAYFKLDTTYFPESVNSITAYEDYDDSKSTHPNLKARREALEEVIDKNPSNGKEWFIINENAFFEAQELSRFECSALFLADRKYPEAIYNSFLLSRKHPDNKFLRKNVGVALHTFATYKNNEKTRFMGDVTDVEGNMQSVYYMLDRLSPKGISILATQYNFETHLLYPEDPFLKSMFERSLHELVFFHEVTDSDFETEYLEEEEEDTAEDIEDEQNDVARRGRSSKVTKLSRTKRSAEDAYAYAFVDAFKNETFKTAWEKEQKDLKAFKKQKNYLSWHNRRVKGKKLYNLNDSDDADQRKDPINKVVVVTPRFMKLKQGSFINDFKPIIKFEETDIEQRKMRELIPDYLDRVGLDADFLDYKTLDKMDDDLFNDLMFVNDWLSEYWDHPRVENMVSSSDRADEFIAKYGTQFIMYTGMITYRKPRTSFLELYVGAIGTVLFPPFILYSAASLSQPFGQVYQFVSVYDVKNGYTRFHFVENFEDIISRAQLKAMIYDKMYRVAND